MLGNVPKVKTEKSHGKCIYYVIDGAIHTGVPFVYNLLAIEEGETSSNVRDEALAED